MLPFALNHMTAPTLGWEAFLDPANGLACVGAECRNDLKMPLLAVRIPPGSRPGLPTGGGIFAFALRDDADGNDFVSYITGEDGNAEGARA
jgi:hypothetical protein